MPVLWTGPALLLGCSVAASAAPEIVFSVRKWDGEYATEDIPGGVRITPCTASIHAIQAEGTGLRQVVDLGGVTDAPGCSPDGQWVYFQSNATGRYRIYRCRPDGSEVTGLVTDEFLGSRWLDAYGYAPSADGQRIAYTVHDGSIGNVVLANADGSEPELVAPDLGYTYMAALSPAGDAIAFSGPAREYRLLVAPLPTGEPVLLTPDHPDSYAPQFTPDGRAIVFIRRDGEVYRVNADGTGLQRLTEGRGYVEFRLSPQDRHGSTDAPHLSPDGARIAYIAVRDGIPNVWTMGTDGSDQRQLTFRETPCGRVRWSPDGSQIAFVSFDGKYPQLFVVPAEGGEPQQLTHLDGAVYFLSWRPTGD
jgi:Tol biopolymer transport system component